MRVHVSIRAKVHYNYMEQLKRKQVQKVCTVRFQVDSDFREMKTSTLKFSEMVNGYFKSPCFYLDS